MSLTPDEIAVLRARLAEAEEARHLLLVGQSVTLQRHDGRTLEYRAADVSKLEAYIAELRRLIACARPPRRTFRVYQSGTGL